MHMAGRACSAFAISIVLAAGASYGAENPSDAVADAWTKAAAKIEQARRLLAESPYARSEADKAEAYSYLTGQMALANDEDIYYANPAFPKFVRSATPERDAEFSNPDTFYLHAVVSDQYAYRIVGRLGTVNQTTIGSYAFSNKPEQTLDKKLAGERATNKTLKTDKDGNFELVISKEKIPAQNWIPLIDGATSVTIYQIYGDWQKERKGEFHIERIGEDGEVPPVATIASMAASIESAGEDIFNTVKYWLDQTTRLYKLPANTTEEPHYIQISSLGSYFAAAHYAVPVGHALVAEFAAPAGADYWGLTLYNAWGQMPDYTHRQTSLNSRQAVADADGKYRIVLSDEDPGVANWLDIHGHPEGTMNWRITSATQPQKPVLRLVPLAQLKSSLPPDTHFVSAEQRKAEIKKRQDAISLRFTN
jgi:hypothetical protein